MFVWSQTCHCCSLQCDNPYDTRYRPERLLVFDKHPGGIGLAEQVGVRTTPAADSHPCTLMSPKFCTVPAAVCVCGTTRC